MFWSRRGGEGGAELPPAGGREGARIVHPRQLALELPPAGITAKRFSIAEVLAHL
jgi:hypothetical protein